jgi:hypothetical protein
MLEEVKNDPEAACYLNPKNGCNFAFPFPEYDGKKAGCISNFHEGERVDFFFSAPEDMQIFHENLSFHMHPRGGEAVNISTGCVYGENTLHSRLSHNGTYMRLYGQVYYNGQLHITAKCVYCECSSIFDKDEAFIIADIIDIWTDENPEQVKYYKEISKRIRETYI